MDKSKRVLILSDSDIESLDEAGFAGYHAIDITDYCFGDLKSDPWESLRMLRRLFTGAKLQITLSGQCLLGYCHYSDDVVDAFIAAAVDNGIDIIRIFDALNDARNLETAAKSIKKYGAQLQMGMIYTESPVHSLSFFAGYASQLASMGADSLCICGMSNGFTCRELVDAVKKSSALPVAVSAVSDEIAGISLDAGAAVVEVYDIEDPSPELISEIELVRADAGHPSLAFPISEIIAAQAYRNYRSLKRYDSVSEDFMSLILGKYGKTPAPVADGFIKEICGNEPLVLVRPADAIEPEYDIFREYVSPWIEQEEDILTYAIYRGQAIVFFETRKAKKYSLDMPHADPSKGIHVI